MHSQLHKGIKCIRCDLTLYLRLQPFYIAYINQNVKASELPTSQCIIIFFLLFHTQTAEYTVNRWRLSSALTFQMLTW